MTDGSDGRVPIFILGISQRSGTNYLFHLLCLHPDCDYGGPLWENYLTLHLDQLATFADSVYRQWLPAWNVDQTIGPTDTLLADLGSGLVRYLRRQQAFGKAAQSTAGMTDDRSVQARRLVTKTPSVKNLSLFHRVFPDARLLLLVRDGRAVVESNAKSFGLPYERAIRNWSTAARALLRWFDETDRASATGQPKPSYLLIRYEDLFRRNEEELRAIFAYLGLDPARYDFAAAAHLPVYGSSELRQTGKPIDWDARQRRSDFDPTRRWHHWSRWRRARFAWLAGVETQRLGYPSPPPPTGLAALIHRLRDLVWICTGR
jgi:hypothetical protein